MKKGLFLSQEDEEESRLGTTQKWTANMEHVFPTQVPAPVPWAHDLPPSFGDNVSQSVITWLAVSESLGNMQDLDLFP